MSALMVAGTSMGLIPPTVDTATAVDDDAGAEHRRRRPPQIHAHGGRSRAHTHAPRGCFRLPTGPALLTGIFVGVRT
jgi:hypothetical protein